MDTREKLSFFYELISCNDTIYSWCYNGMGTLLYSNAPRQNLYNEIFLRSKGIEHAQQHIQESSKPIIMSIGMGMMWAIAFESSENGPLFHVLGPVFNIESSFRDMMRALEPWLPKIPTVEEKYALLDEFQSLPVVSYVDLCRYTLMLHFTLTGEKLHFSDIVHRKTSSVEANVNRPAFPKDRYRVWMNEQALMRMIRDGDLNYKDTLNQSFAIDSQQQYSGTALEQAKINQIIFITLCVRAAIEGGLPPDTAYTVGDAYIRSVQAEKNTASLQALRTAMYEDFIRRVRAYHTDASRSQEIQSCCEYIMMHIEEPLNLTALARHFGYTPYYFSRKFKQEMHCDLKEYIRISKLERAKLLLETSDLNIQEITEKLCFCSRTYFSNHFHAAYGCSPSEYRQKNQHI